MNLRDLSSFFALTTNTHTHDCWIGWLTMEMHWTRIYLLPNTKTSTTKLLEMQVVVQKSNSFVTYRRNIVWVNDAMFSWLCTSSKEIWIYATHCNNVGFVNCTNTAFHRIQTCWTTILTPHTPQNRTLLQNFNVGLHMTSERNHNKITFVIKKNWTWHMFISKFSSLPKTLLSNLVTVFLKKMLTLFMNFKYTNGITLCCIFSTYTQMEHLIVIRSSCSILYTQYAYTWLHVRIQSGIVIATDFGFYIFNILRFWCFYIIRYRRAYNCLHLCI